LFSRASITVFAIVKREKLRAVLALKSSNIKNHSLRTRFTSVLLMIKVVRMIASYASCSIGTLGEVSIALVALTCSG
jgi:hypothetical protein